MANEESYPMTTNLADDSECKVPGCRIPRGVRDLGFSKHGLATHMTRLHPEYSATPTGYVLRSAEPAYVTTLPKPAVIVDGLSEIQAALMDKIVRSSANGTATTFFEDDVPRLSSAQSRALGVFALRVAGALEAFARDILVSSEK